MANTRAPIRPIPLSAPLNLNKLKSEVKPYIGYNRINSPVYGETLSPLNIKSLDVSANTDYVIDKQSNIFSLQNGKLYKNGRIIKDYNEFDGTMWLNQTKLEVGSGVITMELIPSENNTHELLVLTSTLHVQRYSIAQDGTATLEKSLPLAVEESLYKNPSEIRCAKFLQRKIDDKYFLFFVFPIHGYFYMQSFVFTENENVSGFNIWASFARDTEMMNSPFITTNSVGDNIIVTCNGMSGQSIANPKSWHRIYSVTDLRWKPEAPTIDVSNLPASDFPPNSIVRSAADNEPIPVYQLYKDMGNTDDLTFSDTWTFLEAEVDSVNFQDNTIVLRGSTSVNIPCSAKSYTWEGQLLTQGLNATFEILPHSVRANIPSLVLIVRSDGAVLTRIPSQCAIYYNRVDSVPTTIYYSGINKTLLFSGAGYVPYTDDDTTAGNIPYGTRTQTTGFNLLVNYGTPYGLSYTYSSPTDLGVLVSPLGVIADSPSLAPSIRPNICTYATSTDNTTINIVIASRTITVDSMELIFGRYIKLNTIKDNIFDTVTGTFTTGFLDYNNRAIPLHPTTTPYAIRITGVYRQTIHKCNNASRWQASSLSTFYEMEGVLSPGMQLPAQLIVDGNYSKDSDLSFQVSDTFGQAIDFFFSPLGEDLSIAPSYVFSWKNNKLIIGQNKGVYPTLSTALYAISILAKFVKTYINQDVVMIDNIGYPIIYQGTKPVLLTQYLSGVEGVSALFVIQGQTYACNRDYILYVSNRDGVLTQEQAIVSIEGMKFIGATPSVAYFYSSYNRAIYSFTGSNQLDKAIDCTDIEAVYDYCYNPTTGSILVATNIGLLVVTSDYGMFVLPYTDIKQLDTSDNDVAIFASDKLDLIRYNPAEGYEAQPVEVVTAFYGDGNNQVSKTDCLYLRLYSQEPKDGTVTVSAITMTDKAVAIPPKTFEVKAKDWDSLTGTIYLRYQPQFQSAIGVSFSIKSDFAISQISIGATPQGVTQLTGSNI